MTRLEIDPGLPDQWRNIKNVEIIWDAELHVKKLNLKMLLDLNKFDNCFKLELPTFITPGHLTVVLGLTN